MPGHLPNPLLSLTYPLIDSLALDGSPDGSGDEALALHDLWTVFTRCKNELKDGKRLENIAWRLYSPSQAPSHLQPRPRTPSLSSAASTSASSASPTHTGLHPNARLSRSPTSQKRTFGSVLNLVLAADQDEDWQRLRDWVGDAGTASKQRQRELSIPAVAVEDLDVGQDTGMGVRRDTPSESSTARSPIATSPNPHEPSSTPPIGSAATSLSTSPFSSRRQKQGNSNPSSTASSLQTPHRLTASTSTSASTTPHTGTGPSFQLRLVEPTPAPSRVGSLGTDLNNPSSGPGSPALSMSLQPAIEEEESRGRDRSTVDLTDVGVSPLSKSPTKPASASPQVSPIQTKNIAKSAVSPVKKKEKRMFFIQRSPGSVGTVGTGTSGGESETGGSSFGAVSPSTSKMPGSCTSPLSAHAPEGSRASQKRQRSRSRSPMQRRQASMSPSKLGTVTNAPPPSAKVKKSSQTNLSANHGHQRRRSSGSSRGSASKGPVPAQAPAPIKRVVSAATMQGRFRGQKMAAAAAIQEKNQAIAVEREKLAKVQSLKNMQEETGGWEDEDGESEESEDEEDEEDDDEGWSDEGSEEERLSKEEEKKRAAEAEKQRQREMFAKRQIFGPSVGAVRQHQSAVDLQGHAAESERPSTPGLLSGMFKPVMDEGFRRGGSMVDLQQQPHPPVQRRQTGIAPPAAGPSLMRSKSAVAIPVQTGLSVGRTDGHLDDDEEVLPASTGHKASPEIAVKPRPPPGTEMEDSDASDYSAPATSFLATSEARRRLSQLAAKRDASKKKAQSISPEGPSAPLEAPMRAVNGPLLGAPVSVVAPQTPTTTRRNMIMNEMSESLRMNLIWERRTSQASLNPPKRSASFASAARPLVSHVSSHQTPAPKASPNAALQTSASAQNLQQIRAASNSISPASQLASGGTPLARQLSHPVHGTEISPPPPQRKRTAPNLLSGGGILRPLTRVGQTTSSGGNVTPPLQAEASPQIAPVDGPPIASLSRSSKSRSSADLAAMHDAPAGHAPPMVRSNTEGGVPHQPQPRRGRSEVDLLKMQLRKREEETSMSYRSHGW